MALIDFIAKRFIGQELCIYYESDAETIIYDQSWSANREYFQGTVVEAEDGVIVLDIPENGKVYINVNSIVCFWRPGFDYHKATLTSLTRRSAGARRKDV